MDETVLGELLGEAYLSGEVLPDGRHLAVNSHDRLVFPDEDEARSFSLWEHLHKPEATDPKKNSGFGWLLLTLDSVVVREVSELREGVVPLTLSKDLTDSGAPKENASLDALRSAFLPYVSVLFNGNKVYRSAVKPINGVAAAFKETLQIRLLQPSTILSLCLYDKDWGEPENFQDEFLGKVEIPVSDCVPDKSYSVTFYTHCQLPVTYLTTDAASYPDIAPTSPPLKVRLCVSSTVQLKLRSAFSEFAAMTLGGPVIAVEDRKLDLRTALDDIRGIKTIVWEGWARSIGRVLRKSSTWENPLFSVALLLAFWLVFLTPLRTLPLVLMTGVLYVVSPMRQSAPRPKTPTLPPASADEGSAVKSLLASQLSEDMSLQLAYVQESVAKVHKWTKALDMWLRGENLAPQLTVSLFALCFLALRWPDIISVWFWRFHLFLGTALLTWRLPLMAAPRGLIGALYSWLIIVFRRHANGPRFSS